MLRHVEKIHENIYEDSLVTIETESDTIRATLYHPVWVLSGRQLDDRPVCKELEPHEDEGHTLPGRWVNSHDLRPGDVLVDRWGAKQYVMRVAQKFVSGLAIVNLTVEGDHTFAVGECGVLVHNTCAKPVAAPAPDELRLQQLQEIKAKRGDEQGLIQNHHKVPHDNKTYDHQNHPLVKEAEADLRTDPSNQMDLGNHAGRHSSEYHQSVRDRMDDAYEDIAGGGQAAAEGALNDVFDGIASDISDGSLRPYRHKDVWIP